MMRKSLLQALRGRLALSKLFSQSKAIVRDYVPTPLYAFLKKVRLAYRLFNEPSSFLVEANYFQSFSGEGFVNRSGQPIPWMNYNLIDFLEERLSLDLAVFEFGSGSSSIFFANRVRKVVAVEHDKDWYRYVKSWVSKKNTMILHKTMGEDYWTSIDAFDEVFDVIVVGGRERVRCAAGALRKLSTKGILILDDSNRRQYQPVHEKMRAKGYRSLTFAGLKPGEIKKGVSTIFYKDNNCLGI